MLAKLTFEENQQRTH